MNASLKRLQVDYIDLLSPERDLLPMAEALDIGVTAWSPLGERLNAVSGIKLGFPQDFLKSSMV